MVAGARERVQGFDHHLSHAASAYFASPFDRALIVTLDERGDGRCGFAGAGEGKKIRELAGISFPHSLAWFYTQITKLIGFQPHGDEHKTQWLGTTGEPVFADFFTAMLRRAPQSAAAFAVEIFSARFCRRTFPSAMNSTKASESRAKRNRISSPTLRANIATSLQQACTEIVVEWVETLRKQTGHADSVRGRRVVLESAFSGRSRGENGLREHIRSTRRWQRRHCAGRRMACLASIAGTFACGAAREPLSWPAFSNEQIKQVLDNCKATYRWCDSEDQKVDEALRLLQAGRIVAWFQGAAEFGPRALGNRSLLASPWAPYVVDNLNDFVKHREPYRPFALSIPEEDCREYFECTANGRFMTTMATPTPKMRKLLEPVSSGFIVQDRVRLHIVAREDNPLIWKLLRRSGEKGPAPILVNASFNLFGEPLVITPRDAVRSYFCSGVDALMAGNFLLSKR